MKCFYLVLIQCLLSVSFSQVLFEEHFADSNAYLTDEKAQIIPTSLDAKYHCEQGHRLQIADNQQQGVSFPLDGNLTANETLYLTFCYRLVSPSAKDKFSGLILYQDGREVFGMGNDYTSEEFSVWTADGKGMAIGQIPTKVDNDVHQIVMRIDFNADGPETIKVGLDPFANRSETRQPGDIWTTYQAELSFDEMRLRCGNDECVSEFDEIRIATDWESLLPVDDNPGDYITRLTQNAAPAEKSEIIGTRIARFWPAGTDIANVPASLLLKEPRQAAGPVPSEWQLQPQFGTFLDKRYAYLNIAPEIDLYGTGEVTGSLLRNGKKIILFNKDNVVYQKPDQLYQTHPWVLGVRPDGSAFGVIFDSTWMATLDLRAGILFTTTADAQDFPVIIMEGESPQAVMNQLADLTGTMEMPPRWALGYQQCRWSYNPDARVREIADTFRAKRIPCDVIWMDIDYMDGFRIFTFDKNQFPDPKATNDYLHAQGFKAIWMIDPGVKHDPGYFVYDSGTRIDAWVKDASGQTFTGDVWPGKCVFPDFTSPDVRKWWSGLYKNFMATGIDGVWNDMNEPAVFDSESKTMPLDNQHRGGDGLPAGPHQQYHNVYGFLMVKATQQGIKKANPDKRPFVLSRANYLGGHRYAATWTGDNKAIWQHLKWSVPMSINLGLSGQPFNGPDIGGFAESATPDLWAHWISVGAFYPFSRAHTSKGTENQEPWSFGPEVEQTARVALQRRYRLMPYLYTVFRQSHLEGLPVMRPVFFADPADVSLRMEDQAFLLGSDLMVVPKWARSVQQPKGIWQSVSLVPEDIADPLQCDLKARGGSIIPLGPVIQSTEQINSDLPLTLIVTLDEKGLAEGVLYEDAGDGYGYMKGQYCLSAFVAERKENVVTVNGIAQKGDWAKDKRLVHVTVLTEDGPRYGFGDITTEVKVKLDTP